METALLLFQYSPSGSGYKQGIASCVCVISAHIYSCPAVLEAGLKQTKAQTSCAPTNPISHAESTMPSRYPASMKHQHRVFLFAKRQQRDHFLMLFREDVGVQM